jgi:hypothetical protein
MVTIVVATAVALTLACVILFMFRSTDSDQLVEPRFAPLTMSVQIICGDCAGDGSLPVRTSLDRKGHCAQCGGSSYLLASIAASSSALMRAEHLRELQARSSRSRILPFKAPVSRGSRPRKIAV